MDVLYLSPADWDGPRGRFQHLAARMAQHNRVLYADGLGVRAIGARDWRRALRKLRLASRLRPMQPEGDGLLRITPLAVPGSRRPAMQRLNRNVLTRFLLGHMRRAGMSSPLVWLSYPHPDLVAILDRLGAGGLVYDCVDDWSEFSKGYTDLGASERDLLARADVVFTTAPPLQARATSMNGNTHLVPNGVDIDAYAQALSDHPELPPDAAGIAAPRIGFVGNIAEWVDLDLVSRVARAHPEWSFVMIGDYLADSPRPPETNIHWLGFRPFHRMPGYLASFDVCMIPFVDNELTRAVDPLKLYEYLAAGRGVVSTPMPRLDDFSDVVRVARDADGFAAAIRECLAEPPERRAERVAAVRPHSWDARMAAISRVLADTLGINLTSEAA